MSEYKLPSGLASIEMSHPMGEQEGTYPVQRKLVEQALMEAMKELWIAHHNLEQYREAMIRTDKKLDEMLVIARRLAQDVDTVGAAKGIINLLEQK